MDEEKDQKSAGSIWKSEACDSVCMDLYDLICHICRGVVIFQIKLPESQFEMNTRTIMRPYLTRQFLISTEVLFEFGTVVLYDYVQ